MLEEQLAELEGGDRAFSFTSGMAALAAVCKLVKSGEHILAGEDIYGGTSRLLSQVVPTAGVDVTNVVGTDVLHMRYKRMSDVVQNPLTLYKTHC